MASHEKTNTPPATNIANSNTSSVHNAGNNTNNVHLNVNIDPTQHTERKPQSGLRVVWIVLLVLVGLFCLGYLLKTIFSASLRKSNPHALIVWYSAPLG
jgi:hypothetical protein